jgi:bacillithiol system protein YtxJ
MNWIPLTSEDQLLDIVTSSSVKPQVIFKHSTRCSTSSMVLNRLERSESSDTVDFYFLDLIQFRNISAQIVDKFHVTHESPQVLVIKNGSCSFDESHFAINMEEILEQSAL